MNDQRMAFTVTETAQRLGVSKGLVYAMMKRGDLPFIRFGNRKLIPTESLELKIERSMVGVREEKPTT
jgi:excisionase family DNA binding protein